MAGTIMKTKQLIILFTLVLLTGCGQDSSKPDFRNIQSELKNNMEVNTSTCFYESGMKTDEISYLRNLANEVLQYFKNQKYDQIKPYLTNDLNNLLESKGIKEKKLDVFLPGATQIIPAIENFELNSLYEIKTNPKSTEISGFCNDAHNDLQKSIYYKINNPSEEQVGIFMMGRRGLTSASLSLLIKKVDGKWLIDNISIYPGGAAGKTTYEMYQIASQLEQEGHDVPAYLYYELITSITPVNEIMPTFIANSYQSLSKLKVKIPGTKKDEIQDWQVEPNFYLPVYKLKILPVQDKLVILLGYITETDVVEENNHEAQMLAKYVKDNYPVLASYFSALIIEATFEIPEEANYERYATSHKLQE